MEKAIDTIDMGGREVLTYGAILRRTPERL